jgi:hypothetical protein
MEETAGDTVVAVGAVDEAAVGTSVARSAVVGKTAAVKEEMEVGLAVTVRTVAVEVKEALAVG